MPRARFLNSAARDGNPVEFGAASECEVVASGGENWGAQGGGSGGVRRRRRKSAYKPQRGDELGKWLRYVVILLALVLVGTLGWQAAQKYSHPEQQKGAGEVAAVDRPYAAVGSSRDTLSGRWQSDFENAIGMAHELSKGGDVTGAEEAADRATTIVESARARKFDAPAEFFATALRELNAIRDTHPDSDRLREHTFQTKIALAELRVSTGATGADAASAGAAEPRRDDNEAAGPNGADAGMRRVTLEAPKAVNAKQTLNPATVGGNFVDATRMPGSSEVFLPPASRTIEDQVRVSGLTIAGAAQTLDGIIWKDVTFVGTRVRYERGPVSLKNVRFEKCNFGFSVTPGGEKIVDAILRGEGDAEVR
jgi:hypothetical protein